MQFTTIVLLFATAVAGTALPDGPDCLGLGGPLDTHDLAEGADSNDVRKCAAHPLAGLNSGLQKRDCAIRNYGCENNWCWKKCKDDGSWCWQAWNHGSGDWVTCSAAKDCDPATDRMKTTGCGKCNDSSCGCSC
ncbi:hypothetical protein BS50DRAFT_575275 [Corynespora cassiicola Philippines]|uniref:Uncharacterized protein n=1 Tax=Corynespora cassiicola Philippines TaxID=1448308 RepID=A0A2T2NJJ1_CORCC|nr:hypothetical protein BS50DRAFT_575275 [Corynespora cassiicola Philippines]